MCKLNLLFKYNLSCRCDKSSLYESQLSCKHIKLNVYFIWLSSSKIASISLNFVLIDSIFELSILIRSLFLSASNLKLSSSF